jgi:hypothetical protein
MTTDKGTPNIVPFACIPTVVAPSLAPCSDYLVA